MMRLSGLKSTGLGLGLLAVLLCNLPVWAKPITPIYKPQQTGMLSRFYYQAALEMAADHMDMATDLIGRVYRLNPDDFNLAILYGQCLENQNRTGEAIVFYNEVIPHFSESPVAQSLLEYRIALNYDAQNQSPQAIAALNQAIHLYPGHPPSDYYFDMGVFYAKQNRYDQTELYSQKAVDEAPESAEAWNNLGFSLTQLGKVQDGYAAIQKAKSLAPENANILDSLGFVLFKMGRFNDSITQYEKALQLNPTMSESLLYMGRDYDALSQWGQAAQTYQQYLNLSTNTEEKLNVQKRLAEIKPLLPSGTAEGRVSESPKRIQESATHPAKSGIGF